MQQLADLDSRLLGDCSEVDLTAFDLVLEQKQLFLAGCELGHHFFCFVIIRCVVLP